MQKTAEYAARKIEQKRRNIKATSSAEMNCTASSAEVVEMVQKAYILFSRPTATTEEEVADAFNWYFTEYLPQTGVFPTVEGLAASCGITTVTLLEWAKSNDTRSCMVQKAKQILSELDAQLVQNGKIPQVVYIFRAKNFHGMQNQPSVYIVVLSPLLSAVLEYHSCHIFTPLFSLIAYTPVRIATICAVQKKMHHAASFRTAVIAIIETRTIDRSVMSKTVIS